MNAIQWFHAWLRGVNARRTLQRKQWAEPLPVADDALRFGAEATCLSHLAASGIPVQPTLVLDAAALATVRALSVVSAAQAARHISHALGSAMILVRAGEASRCVATSEIGPALATATAPLLLQADTTAAVTVASRAADAPGRWTISAGDKRGDFGRLTGRHLAGGLQQIDPTPLGSILARVEAVVGSACEIRVIRTRRGLQVSSCRPLAVAHPLHGEIDRLVGAVRGSRLGRVSPTEPLFVASAWSESLPRPTPATLALLTAMSDTMPRTVARPVTVLGRLMCFAPTSPTCVPAVSRWRSRRLLAAGRAFATDVRQSRLSQHRNDATLLAAVDLTALNTAEVMQLWQRQRAHFLSGPCADAEKMAAISALAARDHETRLGPVPRMRPRWQQELLSARRLGGAARLHAMHRIAGHRASLDFELAQSRYREVPGALDVLALSAAAKATDPQEAPSRGSAAELAALAEDARHEALRHLDVLRLILLDLDRRFSLGGKIFELGHDEIESLSPDTVDGLRDRAVDRQTQRSALAAVSLPQTAMSADDLERVTTIPPREHSLVARSAATRVRGRGTRVAGGVDVIGRAYVVNAEMAEAGIELVDFRDGDILVTPRVHPAWLGLLARGSGVVCEWGDPDGSSAIAAREHGVAMISSIPNAGQFRTGDRLTLHVDGRVTAEADVVSRLRLVDHAVDSPSVVPVLQIQDWVEKTG